MLLPLNLTRRQWLTSAFALFLTSITSPMFSQTKIRRIQTQYIATIAPAGAT